MSVVQLSSLSTLALPVTSTLAGTFPALSSVCSQRQCFLPGHFTVSLLITCCQVTRGRPCLLFSSGVQRSACLMFIVITHSFHVPQPSQPTFLDWIINCCKHSVTVARCWTLCAAVQWHASYCIMPQVGWRTCRIGAIHFLAGWHNS